MVRSWLALVIACVLAPVIAVSIGAIAYVGDFGAPGDELSLDPLTVAGFGAVFGAIIGIPTMLLIGLPLHFYFQRRGVNGLLLYALSGAVAGVLAAVAFMMWPPTGWLSVTYLTARWSDIVSERDLTMRILTFGALTGVLAASLFWILHRIGRTPPNPATPAP